MSQIWGQLRPHEITRVQIHKLFFHNSTVSADFHTLMLQCVLSERVHDESNKKYKKKTTSISPCFWSSLLICLSVKLMRSMNKHDETKIYYIGRREQGCVSRPDPTHRRSEDEPSCYLLILHNDLGNHVLLMFPSAQYQGILTHLAVNKSHSFVA